MGWFIIVLPAVGHQQRRVSPGGKDPYDEGSTDGSTDELAQTHALPLRSQRRVRCLVNEVFGAHIPQQSLNFLLHIPAQPEMLAGSPRWGARQTDILPEGKHGLAQR